MPANPSVIAPILPIDRLILLFSSGFGSNQPGGFGQQPGFGTGGANPYANPPGVGAPPPRKSNAWIWILGIVGLLGIGMVVCCGGLTWWGFSQGMTLVADMATQEVANDPTIQEHIGEITKKSVNLIRTGEEGNKRGKGENVLVIDIEGNEGKKGELIVQQSKQPQPGNMFSKIDLRLPDGQEFSIK